MTEVLNAPVVADVPVPPFQPGPAGTHITIRGLTKYFAGWPLYENFDLDIPKHKIVSVFGPNGCGKSTLINMIAGLVPIDSGEILFDGKSLKDTKIGYVFQNYREALFPWMRTIDNIAYPLKLEGRSKAEVDRRAPFATPRQLGANELRKVRDHVVRAHNAGHHVAIALGVGWVAARDAQATMIVPKSLDICRCLNSFDQP